MRLASPSSSKSPYILPHVTSLLLTPPRRLFRSSQHVLDLEGGEDNAPKAQSRPKGLNIPLPPDINANDVLAVEVGGVDIKEDEDFLRSDVIKPPPIPTSVETVVLKKLANQELPSDYVDDFELEAPEQEMVVTSIPVEELEQREKVMEEERIKAGLEEIRKFQAREADLAYREDKARIRVNDAEKVATDRVHELRTNASKDLRLAKSELRRQFVSARVTLEKKLKRQKAILKEKFGRLKVSHISAARRYELMWDKVPQPVEVRVHMMKSVASKLRRGNYCILMSMYTRLGGHLMSWTRMPSHFGAIGIEVKHKPSVTSPVHYSGKYYDRELR